jgi:hypothetical protein
MLKKIRLDAGTTVKIHGIPFRLCEGSIAETSHENYMLFLSQELHPSSNPCQAEGLVSAVTSNLSLAPMCAQSKSRI